MRCMQQTEAMLSRWQFLRLCVAGIAGLSPLSLAGCGGSQGGGSQGGGSENDNGARKKDENNGGGGAGGGY
jgi:hypothetical protein